MIRNRTRGQSTHPIRNTSPFLRLHAETIRNRMRGQSTLHAHLKQNAGTIHAFNRDHLLFLAQHLDNPEQNAGRSMHPIDVDQWEAWKLTLWSQGQWEALKKLALVGDYILHSTNGRRDSITDLAQKAESVKTLFCLFCSKCCVTHFVLHMLCFLLLTPDSRLLTSDSWLLTKSICHFPSEARNVEPQLGGAVYHQDTYGPRCQEAATRELYISQLHKVASSKLVVHHKPV